MGIDQARVIGRYRSCGIRQSAQSNRHGRAWSVYSRV